MSLDLSCRAAQGSEQYGELIAFCIKRRLKALTAQSNPYLAVRQTRTKAEGGRVVQRRGVAVEPVIIYVYAINFNQGRPRRQQCSSNGCQSRVRYAGKQLTQCCACHCPCPWPAFLCFSSCCPSAIFVQCEGQTSAAAAHS